jgi:hypothetical protein
MQCTDNSVRLRMAVHEQDSTPFVRLELSKSIWLIAVSAPESDKPIALPCWVCWLR